MTTCQSRDLASCKACTARWNCVWCPGLSNDRDRCIDGSMVGQSTCPDSSWQWRQCLFAGWVLLTLIGLAVAIVALIVIIWCCCCCRAARRRRNRDRDERYERDAKRRAELEGREREKRRAPKTDLAIHYQAQKDERARQARLANPPKLGWFKRTFGRKPRNQTDEQTPLAGERITAPPESNPFSVSDI